ncbi:MAG: ACP S-malonyltransferase [Alphaproteobacteria bacterium]|nr:ACP S-malonyltransferase [Alphaproteobacteria bacterium]
MAKRAFTFPGQGSQVVEMGKALGESFAEARAVYEEVDSALGRNLSTIMFEGPDDVLRLTENAQPALMAVSMAVIRVLETHGVRVGDDVSYVAGHSLGEYSALCAAGTFALADTARLLDIRGRAMQAAVPVGKGAMAAILGLDLDAVRALAAEAADGAVCDVANDNAPGQVVVSGTRAAVERAIEIAKARGAKRAVPLPVSAPFHCSLMAPAAIGMAEALTEVTMHAPAVPLVANVTARPVTDPERIRRHLIEQVTGMVRWTESITWLAGEGGVDSFFELGTGKVLTGLAKRIAPAAAARALGSAEDIKACLADWNG